MNILCPNNQPCADDINAFGNYSSEDPDRELFRSVIFPNSIWDGDWDIWTACFGRCTSTVSQADADLCAHNLGKICEKDKLFSSAEKTCSKTCPNGDVYTSTVPAGTFTAETQAQADALAKEWCDGALVKMECPDEDDPGPPVSPPVPRTPHKPDCNDRQTAEVPCADGGKGAVVPACIVWASNKVAANGAAVSFMQQSVLPAVGCLTEFPRSICKNEDLGTRFIVPDKTAAFVAPYTWDIFGAVPVGITFEVLGLAMKITGQFMASGDYAFRLTLTDANGTFTYRTYNVSVMEIDEGATLPTGDQLIAYSHTISIKGGVDPKVFGLRFGYFLPDGLSLDPNTGTISGTPTTYGSWTFIIDVADKYGATCEKEFTLTIDPAIFDTIVWALSHNDSAPGYGYANGAGPHVSIGAVSIAGSAVAGGEGIATAGWAANNTTGSPLNCRLRVVVTKTTIGAGIQVTWPENVVLERTLPLPDTYIVNNAGPPMPTGESVYLFTVPTGASTWNLSFRVGCSAQNYPPPPINYPGGSVNTEIYLEIV